jgi:hypothetical protein
VITSLAAKVVTQQQAHGNRYAVAHCRKEMYLLEPHHCGSIAKDSSHTSLQFTSLTIRQVKITLKKLDSARSL